MATKKKSIDVNDAWGFGQLMVVAAFRHCCGKQTYIVGACVKWLIEQWPNFSESTRGNIRKDLEREFEMDDKAREAGDKHHPLGSDFDRAEWEKVRNLWLTTDVHETNQNRLFF